MFRRRSLWGDAHEMIVGRVPFKTRRCLTQSSMIISTNCCLYHARSIQPSVRLWRLFYSRHSPRIARIAIRTRLPVRLSSPPSRSCTVGVVAPCCCYLCCSGESGCSGNRMPRSHRLPNWFKEGSNPLGGGCLVGLVLPILMAIRVFIGAGNVDQQGCRRSHLDPGGRYKWLFTRPANLEEIPGMAMAEDALASFQDKDMEDFWNMVDMIEELVEKGESSSKRWPETIEEALSGGSPLIIQVFGWNPQCSSRIIDSSARRSSSGKLKIRDPASSAHTRMIPCIRSYYPVRGIQ